MDVITALCLICMLAIFGTTVVKLCLLSREEKLKAIKNFKRGKFALIYVVVIPLYWMGIAYGGTPIGKALLSAIKYSVELVVLKYDYSPVAQLMTDNAFYRVTVDICYVLIAINALIFTVTLIGKRLYNEYRRVITVRLAKKVYVVVGFNEQNKKIIKSITDVDGDVILLSDLDGSSRDAATDFAFVQKIACLKTPNGDLGEYLKKLFKAFDEKSVNLIINTGDDAKNLILTEQLNNLILSMDLSEFSIDDTRGLNGFVFGEPENASAFIHFVEASKGCIHYINKYKLIAMDFVDKYPLTEFMTEKQLDYATATVRDNVNINVLMVGFGKTNQQIFLTSVANNQFLVKRGKVLVEKVVNYSIFDKNDSKNDKNLNHNYNRYTNEVDENDTDYLPLPQKPANEEFFTLDINALEFYKNVKERLTLGSGADNYNYVVIAFGTDMENLDLAEKLTEKLKEWGLDACTRVFVKIRNGELTDSVINKEYAVKSGFYTFGNEQETVYNLKKIVAEEKEVMARDRHLCYAICDNPQDDENQIKHGALQQWYSRWVQVQRESNIYACLSIRMKLQLMGFDYKPVTDDAPSANDDYQKAYEKDNPIKYDDSKKPVKGKKAILSPFDDKTDSIRKTMVVQEHQRWNAYMISSGIIPSTKTQMLAEGPKNLKLRRHGNITTFEGLKEFGKLEAARSNKTEKEADVIKYDYQLMDDLVWLLTKNGYKIVKR